jgi:glutamate transport system substrate-binding protein
MPELPDYSLSRAILIGTANYGDPGFTPLPAAANSLNAMRQLLATPELCGWPKERITVLENPTDAPRLLQNIRRLTRETDEVLLVYFVGHGVLQRRAQLSLVLADTDSDDSDLTGLDYQRIREILLDSIARVKIVILDCCYSGRAIEALSDEGIANSTETHGVYTLTASDRAAHVVPLDRQHDTATSFTGEFVDLVRAGIAGEPEQLTLSTIYRHLRHRLQKRALPTPNQRGTDTADQFPFTKNAAYKPRFAPSQPPARTPDSTALGDRAPSPPTSVRRIHPPRDARALARFRFLAALVSVLVVAAVVAIWTAWGPNNGATGTGPTTSPSSANRPRVSATPLKGSPTFDAMQRRGGVVIGVREDQPGLGYKDATNGTYSGFDIEIAKLIAAKLGFAEDKITFKPVFPIEREQQISGGTVDYYIGTYTINDKRKQQVSFAGPYYLAGQDLLVRKDDTSITSKDSLKSKKVCSVTGSTPMERVRQLKLTEPDNIVELSTYAQCVDKLLTKEVDVLTTDDAILRGYVTVEPERLKVIGQPFSDEPYGVGMAKDDSVLLGAVNGILQNALDDGTWDAVYFRTLGKSGYPPRKPTIQH